MMRLISDSAFSSFSPTLCVCVAFIVSYFQIDLMAVCVLIFISYFHIMGKSRRQQILENRSFKIQAEEGLGSGCVHGCEGGFWLWQT